MDTPIPSDFDAWMSHEENQMRDRLQGVDFVVRVDFSEDEVHRAQGFYGIAARRYRERRRGAARDFIAEYPALTLTVLVGHAALAYEHGRYWESFWSEVGLPRTLNFENALRESVVPLIQRFELADFPELHGRYVQLLGVHAGIPIHCMGDVIDLAADYVGRGRIASGGALVALLSRAEKSYRLAALDMPVRNFIKYGGGFAIDVLDSVVRLVEESLACDERDEDVSPGGWSRSIPAIIEEGARSVLRTRSVERETGPTRLRRRPAGPTIRHSVADDEISLELPATEQGSDDRWLVSFDEETIEVAPAETWGIEWFEAPVVKVPVRRPCRELRAEQPLTGPSWRHSLVNSADPILIFDMSGRWLRSQLTMPKTDVVIVYPALAQLFDDVMGVEIQPYVMLGAPAGWTGWQAGVVDVSQVSSVCVVTSGGRGILRGVRVVDPPDLVYGGAISGLTTPSGTLVHSARPTLRIPKSVESDSLDWIVRVQREETGDVVEEVYTSAANMQVVSPFSGFGPGDLAGMFNVSVTGSAGSTRYHSVFLLESIEIDHSAWVRVPVSPGGLAPAEAAITTRGSIMPSQSLLSFDRSESRRPIEFAVGADTHRLILTPPYCRIHVGEDGAPVRWRTSAPLLFHPELDEQSVLMVDIPGCTALRLELVTESGSRVKWDCPRRSIDSIYQSDLRRFADAARSTGVCDLTAVAVGADCRLARFVVAKIRPAGTCTSVRIDEGELVFDELRIVDGLAAYIWWATAPWATPCEIPVSATRVHMPRELAKAGDLYVQLYVEDMWVRQDPPTAPGETAFKVKQSGWRRDRNNGRERLSKFLAQGGRAPTSEKTMPEIWTVLARLDTSVDVHAAQMQRDLLHVVSENPRIAMATLGNSTIPALEIPSHVIHTELARKSFRAESTVNELHANPWIGCMIEMSDLPGLFERRSVVAKERSETLEYLARHGGESLTGILSTGFGGSSASGREEEIASDLARLNDAEITQLASESRLVPRPLLSSESRWSGIFEAFDTRSAWVGGESAHGLLAEARHLVQDIETISSELYVAVKERFAFFDYVDSDSFDWLAIPVFSLVLASIARLEAHDMLGDALSPGLIEQWVRVAARCPGLVATDLLLAEALVTHELHGDLVSTPTDTPFGR